MQSDNKIVGILFYWRSLYVLPKLTSIQFPSIVGGVRIQYRIEIILVSIPAGISRTTSARPGRAIINITGRNKNDIMERYNGNRSGRQIK